MYTFWGENQKKSTPSKWTKNVLRWQRKSRAFWNTKNFENGQVYFEIRPFEKILKLFFFEKFSKIFKKIWKSKISKKSMKNRNISKKVEKQWSKKVRFFSTFFDFFSTPTSKFQNFRFSIFSLLTKKISKFWGRNFFQSPLTFGKLF